VGVSASVLGQGQRVERGGRRGRSCATVAAWPGDTEAPRWLDGHCIAGTVFNEGKVTFNSARDQRRRSRPRSALSEPRVAAKRRAVATLPQRVSVSSRKAESGSGTVSWLRAERTRPRAIDVMAGATGPPPESHSQGGGRAESPDTSHTDIVTSCETFCSRPRSWPSARTRHRSFERLAGDGEAVRPRDPSCDDRTLRSADCSPPQRWPRPRGIALSAIDSVSESNDQIFILRCRSIRV
jgi:hypothetical protein